MKVHGIMERIIRLETKRPDLRLTVYKLEYIDFLFVLHFSC